MVDLKLACGAGICFSIALSSKALKDNPGIATYRSSWSYQEHNHLVYDAQPNHAQ
jgi:hypothetical protein